MPWPPIIPPTTRVNATAQLDTHPADHNAIGVALGDLRDRINAVESQYAGGAGITLTNAVQAGTSLPSFTIPAKPYASVVLAWYMLTVSRVGSTVRYTVKVLLGGATQVAVVYGLATTDMIMSKTFFVQFTVPANTSRVMSIDLEAPLAAGTTLGTYADPTNHYLRTLRIPT